MRLRRVLIPKCKEHSRRLCIRCVLFTLGFPVEHVLWEKTPLSAITHLLGV